MIIHHGGDPFLRVATAAGPCERRDQDAPGAITTLPAAYVAVIEVANTVSRAIGYIDDTLPGWPDNEDGVRRYAQGLGYHLVRLLVYSTSTVGDPITRLLDTARACDVAAVITPTLAHIGGDPAPLRAVCDLEIIDPATTYARL